MNLDSILSLSVSVKFAINVGEPDQVDLPYENFIKSSAKEIYLPINELWAFTFYEEYFCNIDKNILELYCFFRGISW